MERAERSSVRLRIKPLTFINLLGKKWREQKEVVLDYVDKLSLSPFLYVISPSSAIIAPSSAIIAPASAIIAPASASSPAPASASPPRFQLVLDVISRKVFII